MGLTTFLGGGLAGLSAVESLLGQARQNANAAGNGSQGGSSSSSSSDGSFHQTNSVTPPLGEVATTVLYENLTNQLKQTVNESKIGQVVPHMDTPAISYGFGISQKCARILMRSEVAPFPKLSQLESLSDLSKAYSEAYPQRLDIFCLLVALFPLVTLRMQSDYTLNIYVAPAVHAFNFTNYYSKRATQLTLANPIVLKTLRLLLTENVVFQTMHDYSMEKQKTNEYAKYFIPPFHNMGCYTFSKLNGLALWAHGGRDVLSENCSTADGNDMTNALNVSPSKNDYHFIQYPGVPGGSSSSGSKETTWSPSLSKMPDWMREFELSSMNPFGKSSSTNNNENFLDAGSGGKSSKMSTKDFYANNPDYYQITIKREVLQRCIQYAGLCYTVPSLVIPAQVLFTVNCVAGRLKVGPLKPGSKVWYPFEEMVEMLPSLSCPQKDPSEMSMSARWFGQHSHWAPLSVAVIGFGVLGVVFGSLGGGPFGGGNSRG